MMPATLSLGPPFGRTVSTAALLSLILVCCLKPCLALATENAGESRSRRDGTLFEVSALCESGQRSEAVDLLIGTIRQAPHDMEAAEQLYQIAGQDSDLWQRFSPAETWRTLMLGPAAPAWWSIMGRLLASRNPEAARYWLAGAISGAKEFTPASIDAWIRLLSNPEEEQHWIRTMRDRGCTPKNLGAISVSLARRTGRLDLALDRLLPLAKRWHDDPRILMQEAQLLLISGRCADAVDAAERALLEAKRQDWRWLYPEILRLYAKAQICRGNEKKARTAYRSAVESSKWACEANLARELQLEWAASLQKLGNMFDAAAVLKDALDRGSTKASVELAGLLEKTGRLEEALFAAEEAEIAVEMDGGAGDLMELQQIRGRLLAKSGRTKEALGSLGAAFGVARETKNSGAQAEILLETATVWLRLSVPKQAAAILRAALKLELPERKEAKLRCGLAEIEIFRARPKQALGLAAGCQELGLDVGDRELWQQGVLLEGQALNRLGRWREAFSKLEGVETRGKLQKAEGARWQTEVELARGWALAHLSRGGEEDLESAAKRASAELMPLLEAESLRRLAWIQRTMGNLEAARHRLKEATRRASRAALFPEERPGALDPSAVRTAVYEEYLDLLAEQAEKAASGSRRGRKGLQEVHELGWRVADLLAGEAVRRSFSSPRLMTPGAAAEALDRYLEQAREVARVEACLDAPHLGSVLRYHIQRWISSSALPAKTRLALRDRAQLSIIGKELRAFLEELRERQSSRLARAATDLRHERPAVARTLAPPPAMATVQKALASKEVLLSWVVGGNRLWILGATKKRTALSRVQLSRGLVAALRDYVEALRRPPGRGEELDRSSGRLVYEKLLADPLRALGLDKPPRRLTAILDGELAELPLGALPVDESSFLIQDTTVSAIPSLAWLSVSPPNLRTRPKAVFFGAPFLPRAGGPESLEPVMPGLPDGTFTLVLPPETAAAKRLPYSALEVETVAQRFGEGATLYLEGSALESEVSGLAARSASILHFAAPAFSGLENSFLSGILLSRGEDDETDGFLSQREILGLGLTADVIVLSGNRTHSGSRAHDVVASFQLSGSSVVLTGLWPHADRSAVFLLGRFHGYLPELGPIDSLRRAQLDLLEIRLQDKKKRALRKFRHPYYWSGYRIFGRP